MTSDKKSYRGDLRDNIRSSWGWIAVGVLLLSIFLYIGYRLVISIIFGIFIYYGTRPVYRKVKEKMGDRKSALFSVLIVGLPMLVLFVMVLFSGYHHITEVLQATNSTAVEMLPKNTEFSEMAELFSGSLRQIVETEGVYGMFARYLGIVSSFADTLLRAVFTLFFSFVFAYLLFSWGPEIRKDLVELFGNSGGVLEEFMEDLDKNLSILFFGNLVNMLITGTIATLTYLLMNYFSPGAVYIPSPITVGLAAGFASLIPILGPKIVYVPVFIFMLWKTLVMSIGLPGYVFSIVFLVISSFVVDGVPDMVIRPIVSGGRINQGALFVSYLVGPVIFGFVGFFLLPVIVMTFISFHRKVLPGFKKNEAG